MSWCLDDSMNSWLSPDDWQGLQRALGQLRQPAEDGKVVNCSEVITILQEAGAANASELYGALTKRFRLLRL